MQHTTPQYRIGLALGGGGARGFAHLGVIQAMYEFGLKPDIISGTSVGSIVGAMIASGRMPEECLRFFEDKKILNFAWPTVSKKGFMTMNRLEKELRKFIRAERFEELEIPLIVTASDITRAVPVHFEQGELIPRVIASCSIPIVFTPKEIDNIEYVDGGVFMNLPVRPIRKRCEKVVAVEINAIDTSEKIKNMLDMAVRTFHLGIARNTDIDRNKSDIYIAPQNLSKYSIFDLSNMRAIYNEGYESARNILLRSVLCPETRAVFQAQRAEKTTPPDSPAF